MSSVDNDLYKATMKLDMLALVIGGAAPWLSAAAEDGPDPKEVFLESFQAAFEEIVSGSPDKYGETGAMYVALSHPLIGDHKFLAKDAGGLEDHWGIGSLSKTFMATLIILFVERGLLGMDQTVPEMLPELNTTEAYGDVTLYQLLTMTSGVPDFFNDPGGLLADTFSDPGREFTLQDVVDGAVRNQTVEAPGAPGYSSTNYVVLQAIAEKVGGGSANELYAEHIYQPLGMSLAETVLPPRNGNAPVPPPRSEATLTGQCAEEFAELGWNHSENGVAIGDDITDTMVPLIDLAGAAGSMWSILDDMLIWTKSGVGNSLLSPGSVAQRLDYRMLGLYRQYGMGTHSCWQTGGDSFFSEYWGHAGEAFGYESLACHHPEDGGSFFIATTSCGVEASNNAAIFQAYQDALASAKDAVEKSPGRGCRICGGGVAMSGPKNVVPQFGNVANGSVTCEEYDAELSRVAAENCSDVQLDWQVDLASYCGCEGARLDTNIPDGGCSLCKDGETFEESLGDITGGHPLANIPLSCQYVHDVSPHLKYISGCKKFREWYGTGVCCYAAITPIKSPTAAPVSSAISGQVSLLLLGFIFSSVVVIW